MSDSWTPYSYFVEFPIIVAIMFQYKVSGPFEVIVTAATIEAASLTRFTLANYHTP
jgi:hypothetical protein